MSQGIMKYQQKELKAEREKNKVLCDRIAVLEAACTAAYEWINRFGEHSPIVFGGEPELAAILNNALKGGAE